MRINKGLLGISIGSIIFWANVWFNGLFSSIMGLIIIAAIIGIIIKLKENGI